MAETKKFSPMRYTASTEEAAVQNALDIVGVSRADIDYEVLDRSEKGVTVRIKPRSDAASSSEISTSEAVSLSQTAPIAEPVPDLMAADANTPEMIESEAVEEPEVEEPEIEEPAEVETEISAEFDLVAAQESDLAPLNASELPFAESEEEIPFEEDYDDSAPQFAELHTENVAATETETETETEIESPMENGADEFEVALIAPLDPAIIERAQAKAQEFLDKMGIEASAQRAATSDAGTVALVIEGPDVGILIGKHGATLQSFQYLLNLTLNAHIEGEGTRTVVDAGNYRARRQSSLEQTARSAASRARRENRPIRLEPMPAHERRLVHMFLQTEADIATQSEGREPMRRIVISPAMRAGAPRGFERPSVAERPAIAERPLQSDRSTGSDRSSYGERRGGGGMGSYNRRGGNSGGNGGSGNGGGRGFNRGR